MNTPETLLSVRLRGTGRRVVRTLLLALLLATGSQIVSAQTRALRVVSATHLTNQAATVNIQFVALGNENALGFSLSFDSNLLAYRSFAAGPAVSGAVLNVNTNQLPQGRLGFALAQPIDRSFPTGTNDLLRLQFLTGPNPGTAAFLFTNVPVELETADAAANLLATSYESGALEITPLLVPFIVTPPQSQTVYAGTNVALTVAATGSAPLWYQWQFNSANLFDATNAALSLTNVAVNQSGDYRVIVHNAGGAVTSRVAVLVVNPALIAPAILVQPRSQLASVGEQIVFGVEASGTPPLRYQWQRNNVNLTHETNGVLVLSNVTTALQGNYRVLVRNDAGTATSQNASLSVFTTPRLVRVVDRSAVIGELVEVPVELLGYGDENAVGFSLAFDPDQISYGGLSLGAGASGASLILNTNQLVSGRLGVVLTQPTGQSFASGTTELLRLRLQAGPASGTNGLTFQNDPVTCEVADFYGHPRPADFQDGQLIILSTAPVVVASPRNLTVPIFSDARFEVLVSGSVPLAYQWIHEGVSLPAGTNATLLLAGVTLDQAGAYQVVVDNAAGRATSAVATLTVMRVVQLPATNIPTGNPVEMILELLAGGDENSVGFSLSFDPARLRILEVAPGPDTAGATWQANTNTPGRVGFALAWPAEQTFAPGTQQVARVRFEAGVKPGDVPLIFSDEPVLREIANIRAQFLPVVFRDSHLTLVLAPPLITQPPVAQTVLAGQNVSFNVAATGSLPFTYQWRLNGTNLPGATNAALLISSVQPSDAGNYSVRIGNTVGSVFSGNALLTVQVPQADLSVRRVTGPVSATAGQPVTVTWEVVNLGNGEANSWVDQLSLANTPAGGGAQGIGSFIFNQPLPAGQTLTNSRLVILPAGVLGDKYFFVRTDASNQLAELNELNNSAASAQPVRITSADLVVPVLSAPGSASFGATIPVSWTVQNIGSLVAGTAWLDELYLSTASNNLTGATLLRTTPALTTLGPGADYSQELSLSLPLEAGLTPGNWFLVVRTDATELQPESNEGNNLRSVPLTLTVPPLPDLAVVNITAPTNAVAGQTVILSWAITNQGGTNASGAWSESIYLSGDDLVGGDQLLLTARFTNDLPAGTRLGREQAITIPRSGAAGTLWLVVETDSRREIVEQDELNNASVAGAPLTVPSQLTLTLATTSVPENAANPNVQATVTRNGSLSSNLVINVTSSDPRELTVPASVTMAAGQDSVAFNATVQPDFVFDNDSVVQVSVSAPGYLAAASSITVRNVDLPVLTLELTQTNLVEGETTTGWVTRQNFNSSPLTVTLSSSSASQLSVPATVLMASNQATAPFTVTAVEDFLVEATNTYLLTATASGYNPVAINVVVPENDVPDLEVTLAAARVSEGQGPNATTGTVTRDRTSPQALVAGLTSTDPAAAQVPATVTIPAGQTRAVFSVSAVDDLAMDGPQVTTIRAFVLDSTTRLPLREGTPATLEVTDDDGPTLWLEIAAEVVGEGLAAATTARLWHNNSTNLTPLVVNLTSSDLSEATVPVSVTIPAGTNAAVFTLASLDDGVTDGNQAVTITASAPGFTSGTDTLVISDADLADLVVLNVSGPASGQTDGPLTISFRIQNQGRATAPAGFVQRLFFSPDPAIGDDTLAQQVEFGGPLPPGQGFDQTLRINAPHQAGNYWVVVAADANNTVDELLENNNAAISAAAVQVEAAYTATVAAGIHSAPADTPVPLSGLALRASSGQPAAFELVNLHLVVQGTRRVISVLTGADGRFATTFQPLPGEAGVYTVAAAHPGVAQPAPQDTFTLYGFRIAAVPALVVIEGESAGGSTSVENLSSVPLSSLAVTVVSHPPNLIVTANLATNQLPGNGTLPLFYQVASPLGATTGGLVQLRVTSAEGAANNLLLPIQVKSLKTQLTVTPGTLSGGMRRGSQGVVQFAVTNTGGLASGPVQVVLPPLSWMTVASGYQLPSLAPGEGTAVSLLLTPPPDLMLGAYRGTLVLEAASASVTVPFNFLNLSDEIGQLRVSAVDEYTYYAEGSPRITNATVRITDAITGQLLIVTNTFPNGEVLLTHLTESYYDIEVTALDHNSFRDTVLVEASKTNDVLAFLARQTVRYFWTVEPTQIEDRTRITIETVFETVVPMPVVTIEPNVIDLAEMTAKEMQVNLKISNHGLIAANRARLYFGTHPDYSFTPLIAEIGALPAQSSLTVPLMVQRIGNGTLNKRSSGGGCAVSGGLLWDLLCGPRNNTYNVPIAINNAGGDCGGGGVGFGRCDCGPGSGGGGVLFVGPSYGGGLNLCDPCTLKKLEVILGCIVDFLPLPGSISCIKGLHDCGTSLSENPDWIDAGSCVVTIVECFGKEVPVVGQVLTGLGCYRDYQQACEGLPEGRTGAKAGRWKSIVSGSIQGKYDEFGSLELQLDRLAAILAPLTNFFGDPTWFECRDPVRWTNWITVFQADTQTNSDGGLMISAAERTALLALPLCPPLTEIHVNRFLDRWNRSLEYYQQGIYDQADVPEGWNTDFIALNVWQQKVALGNTAAVALESEGYSDPVDAVYVAHQELVGLLSNESGGTCAKVRLRLEQEAVLTRDAFQATLEVENRTGDSLEEVFVEIIVRDRGGQLTTSLFGIRPPELEYLNAVDGTGVIAANSTGQAKWMLIPTSEAAPTVPVEHFVSGTLRYRQSGVLVTIPLAPTSIEVLPNPSLVVRYFHQRDVFSDDPFTDEIEPSVPYSLAVMVENQGFGMARNLRITSAQPQIIENEKGLLIDFEIIAAEAGGQGVQPSLTVNLGDLPPGAIALGRWLLKSSLQGLFLEYSATFEHLDDLDDPRLSLIDRVEIHEMNHLVQADRQFEDGRPDFLVNDVGDVHDYPDTLWFSSGTNAPVLIVTNATTSGAVSASNLTVQLSAVMPEGWAYLRGPDPAAGKFRLAAIRRVDNSVLAVDTNAWITDRTFVGFGQRPRRENILHLLDYHATPGSATYTLVYLELAVETDTTAPVSSVAALPVSSSPEFAVQWSGADEVNGSGLAGFDLYVSDNGGPFIRWLAGTTANAAVYHGAANHTYAFYSIAVDQAGNRESPPATPDALTATDRINHAPLLITGADQVVDEGQIVLIDNLGSDTDIPPDGLSFRLGAGSPAGVQIHPLTGLITWPTGEGTGPSTNVFTVILTDDGVPPLTATGWVTVVVREVNAAPILDPVPNYTLNEGDLLTVTNVAYDSDLPRNRLTFSLGATVRGAVIDPLTGLFQWSPSETQGPSTNLIEIIVRDDGVPSLSATQHFVVIVRDVLSDFVASLGSTNLMAGETGAVPLLLKADLDLTDVRFTLETISTRLSNLVLTSDSPEVISSVLVSSGANRSAVSLVLDPGRRQAGTRAIARLQFRALANEHSAVVPLHLTQLLAGRVQGPTITNGQAYSGRVIVVAREPVLKAEKRPAPWLTLYGIPGASYVLESATNLAAGSWTEILRFPLTNRFQEWPQPGGNQAKVFYRAREFQADPPQLEFGAGFGPHWQLLHYGVPGKHYDLETATQLPGPWQSHTDFTLTNSFRFFEVTNDGGKMRLFRSRQQP